MERTVDGKDMAEAFRAAIRANYAEPAFGDEVTMLVQFMRSSVARKGDHIPDRPHRLSSILEALQ